MRFMPVLALALSLTTPLTAGEYVVRSKITSAVISPDGARITRSVDINVPAGKHVIVLADLLEGTGVINGPQISFDHPGVQIIAYDARPSGLYPVPKVESDAAKEAKAAPSTILSWIRKAQRARFPSTAARLS
jgi:hypothetical protein